MRATHDEVELTLVVTSTAILADGVQSLTLSRLDGESLPAWSPGAHVDLTLGDGLVRQYSLCGDPAVSRHWTIAVLREVDSRGGSAYLHDSVGVGTVLAACGPRNHFELIEAPAYIFVAGGIGITPLLPMLGTVQEQGSRWRLVYGGRARSSMAFADQLVRRYGERVSIVPEDECGLLDVDTLVEVDHIGTAIYCCGPEGLIQAVESAHSRIRRGSLHVERFTAREGQPTRADGTFEVEALRSGVTVTVDPSTTILDALESAGVRVLSSCREGLCGTCEVVVLDGVPEHRDSILGEVEQQASKTMFICISRCLSRKLVLDI